MSLTSELCHWGRPRSLETYAQETGRAGRDGRLVLSVMFFEGRDTCDDNMKLASDSTVFCGRRAMLKYFGSCKNVNDHVCCDLCTSACGRNVCVFC